MLRTLVCIFIVSFLAACTAQVDKPHLSPSNIPSQFFNLQNDQPQVIRTAHGTTLLIEAGTFKTKSPVTLEIKEVFTADEILRSGINTTSDGKLLRSAGMIYFNATADGQSIQPSIPVTTTIPTAQVDPDMRLFKGEIGEDSSINWTNPAPTDTLPGREDMIAHGRSLFNALCRSCHGITKDGTGPALAGLEKRGPWSNPWNIKAYINNTARFMSVDTYTQDLKNRYGSIMPPFPNISMNDVVMLMAYINSGDPNASPDDTTRVPPLTGDINSPCLDTSYLQTINSYEEYDTSISPVILDDEDQSPETFANQLAEYRMMAREGYTFEITANGWYNIDAFIDQTDEQVKPTSLSATVKFPDGPFGVRMYLFIPNMRVLQQAYLRDGDVFGFGKPDDLKLPHGERAVLIAIGSKDYQVFYGAREFTIGASQQLVIDLQETTADKLQNVLASKNINGVNVTGTKRELKVDTLPCFLTEPEAMGASDSTTTFYRTLSK